MCRSRARGDHYNKQVRQFNHCIGKQAVYMQHCSQGQKEIERKQRTAMYNHIGRPILP